MLAKRSLSTMKERGPKARINPTMAISIFCSSIYNGTMTAIDADMNANNELTAMIFFIMDLGAGLQGSGFFLPFKPA